jgi:1-deoxy-D-xylulose-5-phosphate reductoisomerase
MTRVDSSSEARQGIAILGATGSIGSSTLDVLARHPQRFRVVALSANRNVERMLAQCIAFKPEFAVMVDPGAAAALAKRLASDAPQLAAGIEVLTGGEALVQVAALPQVDTVMAAIVGAAGLASSLAAAAAGKRVLLANKEALVMSGHLFMDQVVSGGAELLPIDSEHNAIFQCLPVGYPGSPDKRAHSGVRRILLTGSGGPFRTTPLEALAAVTPAQACAHPNWDMGRKISVDSATMMNKGLELIEACWLFDASPDQVEVVLHPQSVIHSMVDYVDGSVLAQMGNPDMRTPIAHALAWPQRMASGVAPLDLHAIAGLTFEAIDLQRYPALGLAFDAARAGGTAPALLNAANEIAVQAFLEERLPFTAIAALCADTLAQLASAPADDLETVLDADRRAREYSHARLQQGFGR